MTLLHYVSLAVAAVVAFLVAVAVLLHAFDQAQLVGIEVVVYLGALVVAHVLAEVEARHDAAQHLHAVHRDAAASLAWHRWDLVQIACWLAVAVGAVAAGKTGEVGTLDVVAALVLYVGARAWWFDGRRNELVGKRWTYVGAVDDVDRAGGAVLGRHLPAVRFGVWVGAVCGAAVLVLG